MKRPLLMLLILTASLPLPARHYNLTGQRLSTADGLPTNIVSQLWQDADGYMWFDTRNGACRFDGYVLYTPASGAPPIPKPDKELKTRDASWHREGQGRLSRRGRDGSSKSWQLIPQNIIAYTRNDHFHVADVDERTEAVSTYGSGLYLYDKPTGELTHISKNDGSGVLDDDYLTGLFVDSTGCIWVIEDYLGVKCLRQNRLPYDLLQIVPGAENQDVNNIRCIAPLSGGSLLVSNQTGDVYDYAPATGLFRHTGNEGYRVYAALRDTPGHLWTGTRGNGLWCDGQRVEGLPSVHIFNIRADGHGGVWVSMLEGGVAHCLPDGRREVLLTRLNAHDARPDRQGRLWVAAEEGLYLLDGGQVPSDSLRGCFVCLHTDHKGEVWAGSTDQGLVRVRTENGQLRPTFYNRKNGLQNNSVYCIAEDQQGHLWVGTEEGLSQLDTETGNIVNYQITDSRLANVFNERTAVCLPDGRLLFGARDGIALVTPAGSGSSEAVPTAVTGLLANGQPTAPEARLSHQQNNLTFMFSNFQYATLQSVRYQFWLEQLDKTWSQPTSEHSASYRELPPGRYTFHVRSCNAAGLWGPETTMSITIHQPWWNTWWAWCLYLLAAGGVGGMAATMLRRTVRLRRQLDMERRMAAFKMDFYDRIERELRNPVNVLKGATENVQLSGTSKTTMQSLRRGSRRMLKLMDMLRQFHRLNDMELQARAEQDAMNQATEARFREIQESIHAEETELKELAPPPINDQLILIVEDDEDNLTHLTDTLNPYFQVKSLTGMDGGASAVEALAPSLVVMDISSNTKKALALTRELAEKHPALPVIHLSADDSDAHQLHSLRSGAADYLVKPFSGKVLLERIKKALAAMPTTAIAEAPKSEAPLTDLKERQFLNRFEAMLASHVADEQFSVERFAELMNLGRTQFYKKVKALTGQTPVAHLQRARLDYAARLLRETPMPIEEVMNRAGFHSSTYFYNAFKKQFGTSPGDYRQCNREV